MKITSEKIGDVLVIVISGRLDANNSTEFQEQILPKIDAGDNILALDFSQVDYISSAGLRVLLMAAKKINASTGKMALFALKDQIKEVFDIAGFTMIFQIFQSRDEALASFIDT
ncbi:MAG: STAS domain-containing protein [Candidatus Marinimicrobia bacterium]|nr:STAS domain-containing protein [Candidatus Neomarinimicrobiota bacterium]